MGVGGSYLDALGDAVVRAALDEIPQGFAYYDAEDRCRLWNRRYAEMWRQWGLTLVPGTAFIDMLRAGVAGGRYPQAKGREAAWIAERIAGRAAASYVSEIEGADGVCYRMEQRRTPDGGRITTVTDISELKAATRALQLARDRAEAASVAKSEFLTNMSHEIRTPLNGLLGLVEVLSRTELDTRQREMIAMALTSGRALNTLLSDILDLAKIEAGLLNLGDEVFDLRQAATEAAVLFESVASEKGLRFQFSFEGGPTAVVGDALRLRQVIANLTSNAVKFTSDGEVAVAVRTRPANANELDLKVTVRDTGPGFDEATRARLFGRFEQGDASITRRFGGAGLGLSIAAQLAALMAGRIDCASAPGRGSVFIFSARLRLAEALTPSTESANDRLATLPPQLRVLLAEDHPTNQKVVALMLGEQVSLDIAADGHAAVRAFAAKPYDLVLMDTQMPIMDGLAAIREIRALEATRGGGRTPVISLTANAMPAQVEECRTAGADLHLAKPITVAGLFGVIHAALGLLPEGTSAAPPIVRRRRRAPC